MTPAQRLSLLEQLLKQGILSKEQAIELLNWVAPKYKTKLGKLLYKTE